MQLALELGVEPSRIDTIADFEAVAKYGVKGDGNAVGASANKEVATRVVFLING